MQPSKSIVSEQQELVVRARCEMADSEFFKLNMSTVLRSSTIFIAHMALKAELERE